MGSLYGICAALSALSSCPEPENKFNRVAGQSVGSASSSAGQAFRPDQNRPGRDRAWSGLAWLDLTWACAPSSSSSSVPPARFSSRLDIAAQKLPQTNQQSDSPSLLSASVCVRVELRNFICSNCLVYFPPPSPAAPYLAPHSASLHIYNFIYETGLFYWQGGWSPLGWYAVLPPFPLCFHCCSSLSLPRLPFGYACSQT